jgi:hypothetical protein
MVRRFVELMSGVIEIFTEKLKWIGSGRIGRAPGDLSL